MWEVKGRRRRKGADPSQSQHEHTSQAVNLRSSQLLDGPNTVADPVAVSRAKERMGEHLASLRQATAFVRGTTTSVRMAWTNACRSVLATERQADDSDISGSGRMLCLGIGSVATSESSAYQLALAIVLAEYLDIGDRAWADPQMSAVDRTVGAEFGFAWLDASKSSSAARPGNNPLLLYMPHCDRALYEAVLATNFKSLSPPNGVSGSEQLARCVLVGNSFGVYVGRDSIGVRVPGMTGALGESLLQRLASCVVEHRLHAFEPCVEAFNDMAVINFPRRLDIGSLILGAEQSADIAEESADEAEDDADDADDVLLWHSTLRRAR